MNVPTRRPPHRSTKWPGSSQSPFARLRTYEQRGKTTGHEREDWLQAEAEFVHRKTKAAGALET